MAPMAALISTAPPSSRCGAQFSLGQKWASRLAGREPFAPLAAVKFEQIVAPTSGPRWAPRPREAGRRAPLSAPDGQNVRLISVQIK